MSAVHRIRARMLDAAPPDDRVGAERAELHRQGAKAAARGDAADTNPLTRPQNSPEHTGEADAAWQQRHDAWQEGHDAQEAMKSRAP